MTAMMIQRMGNALYPVTDNDKQAMLEMKIGKPYRIEAKQQSSRSLQHHRLYWGGLVGLMLDYWEPDTGLVTVHERKTSLGFASWLESQGVDHSEAVRSAIHQYLHHLQRVRAEKMPCPKPATADQIHRWIKIQAGWCDVVRYPDGNIVREAHSTSFAKMSQEEFNVFYKAACAVCWKFVLSQHFGNEQQMQQAIERLAGISD